MSNLIDNVIKGFPVLQNKQDFVVSVFTIEQIFKFTKFTNRLIVGYDEEQIPIYNDQIQRYVEKPRVDKISDFLTKDPDATFPTNLVLHIPKEVIENQNENDGIIEITLNNKVFEELKHENGNVFITIIDGQHRIKGIEQAIQDLKDEITFLQKSSRDINSLEIIKELSFKTERLKDLLKIELVVTFFIDKTLEYQAMIFSTINRTQKKVSSDLVSSLFGLTTTDTPQKIALQVVLSLNGHINSPFYKRIKLYGGSYSKDNSPPLSQATMVSSIVNLISESIREAENDRYLERQKLLIRSSGSQKPLPFRKFYANNEDYIISDIFYYFFNSVKYTFKDKEGNSYWEFKDEKSTENILQTTVGYESLLKILTDILREIKVDNIKNTEIFDVYLVKAKTLNISDINRYSFNNRGKRYLYLDMSLAIWETTDFNDSRYIELKKLENE
ncbi:DGQHR domain-containing protein [Flavobacterium pectinovorum]|uniref:DGQHR domain-containing protein n=1 Tax=Flavobacterium pectinovorum TaxID=29533 RepID=UPI001FAC6845|nr:DGQHR domain-containing protein [Flavobacterium pectinovorum]MCI9843617.1 DGQHR domain-containing protein [Flavobacterium pectinovorum]